MYRHRHIYTHTCRQTPTGGEGRHAGELVVEVPVQRLAVRLGVWLQLGGVHLWGVGFGGVLGWVDCVGGGE